MAGGKHERLDTPITKDHFKIHTNETASWEQYRGSTSRWVLRHRLGVARLRFVLRDTLPGNSYPPI